MAVITVTSGGSRLDTCIYIATSGEFPGPVEDTCLLNARKELKSTCDFHSLVYIIFIPVVVTNTA